MSDANGKKIKLKSSFKVSQTIGSIYTGGKATITSDENLLITAVGEDINVTDIHNGKTMLRLSGDGEMITTFAVTPDGRHLVSSSRSLSVKIWDLTTGKIKRSFKAHEAPIIVMDIDATSTLVATGSADSTIKVWDIDGGFCTHNFKGHGGLGHVSIIRGLDVTRDGKFIISGARDKVVNIWDFGKKTLVNTFIMYETIEKLGVLQPHTKIDDIEDPSVGEMFYTGGDKGIIRIWDLQTGKLIKAQEPEKNTTHIILDIIDILTAITSDQNILFYQIASGLKRVKQIVGHNDEIIDLAYVGPEESHLAVATNTEQIRLYDVQSFNCNIIYGHKDIVICLARSYDGKMLISGSKDRTARIWNIDVNNETADERDRTIKVWDLSPLGTCWLFNFWDANPDTSDENLKPKALYTHHAHEKDINSIAVSSNDKTYATGSQDKTIKIWSVVDGSLLGTCVGHKRGVWSVQFSPVDHTLVSSSGDKTIKIWSSTNFSCLKTLEGHTNSVLKVSFLTSGLQLISCGSDGLLKLWTIKSNECVATLDNHTEKIWALAVRKDEKVVASGGADSLINLWEDITIEEIEQRMKLEEEIIIKEQDLSNYLKKKDYRNAIILAISLNQPFRLLTLFTEVFDNRPEGDTSITGSGSIDEIIGTLSKENLEQMLKYLRDWNTNARHSRTAQIVLNLLDGLLPYTERHYQRLDRMLTDSYIIDYTLHAMDLLDPIGGNEMDIDEQMSPSDGLG
ncbi:1252_t:CDS:10 [Acaulospora colombiana]|uniref:1252_t:CDS:1 n=1 Tax=Acaulospora colombiana TaxID=27376 RepID=A0ACA9KBD4_9GLOM|nr:1252_t:CDS:10 [Acaulospora colombiana]